MLAPPPKIYISVELRSGHVFWANFECFGQTSSDTIHIRMLWSDVI